MPLTHSLKQCIQNIKKQIMGISFMKWKNNNNNKVYIYCSIHIKYPNIIPYSLNMDFFLLNFSAAAVCGDRNWLGYVCVLLKIYWTWDDSKLEKKTYTHRSMKICLSHYPWWHKPSALKKIISVCTLYFVI